MLNRNPTNYFSEVEQIAFSPAHLVPGIEPRYYIFVSMLINTKMLVKMCDSAITVCFRLHSVFPSLQCVSAIKVSFHDHIEFPLSQCVSVIAVCFCNHSVFLSSQCVSIIKVCFCHHSVSVITVCFMFLSCISNGHFCFCFIVYQYVVVLNI